MPVDILSTRLSRRELIKLGVITATASPAVFTSLVPPVHAEHQPRKKNLSRFEGDGISVYYEGDINFREKSGKRVDFIPDPDHIKQIIRTLALQHSGPELEQRCLNFLSSSPLAIRIQGENIVEEDSVAYFKDPQISKVTTPEGQSIPLFVFPRKAISDVVNYCAQDPDRAPFIVPHEMRHLVEYIENPQRRLESKNYQELVNKVVLGSMAPMGILGALVAWKYTRSVRQVLQMGLGAAIQPFAAKMMWDGAYTLLNEQHHLDHSAEYEYTAEKLEKNPELLQATLRSFKKAA